MVSKERSEFERSSEEKPLTIVQALWMFIAENKKLGLIPILLVLSFVGLIVVLGSTGAAPLIYSLFGRVPSDSPLPLECTGINC